MRGDWASGEPPLSLARASTWACHAYMPFNNNKMQDGGLSSPDGGTLLRNIVNSSAVSATAVCRLHLGDALHTAASHDLQLESGQRHILPIHSIDRSCALSRSDHAAVW